MTNETRSWNKVLLLVTILTLFFSLSKELSNATIPRPDHVVVCLLENHSYSQIIANSSAPFINELVLKSANLMEYYALTHPSQPNYLMLFSGSNQGEATDNLPAGTPWTTPNLGASLINSSFTFKSFSEGLPSMGSTVATSGSYARKHCPWVNWQGNGTNQIPASSNLSMAEFPTNYNDLPNLSFVIPNQNNDMHNGSDPSRIAIGDSWVEQYLRSYVEWAQLNNSLLILLFDEDNFTTTNKIMCLFIGPMVREGNYYLKGYSHYDLLHTIEEMYGLPYAGNSINGQSIDEIWLVPTGTIPVVDNKVINSFVYPNPMTENSLVYISNDWAAKDNEMHFRVYDIAGKSISDEIIHLLPGTNSYAFRKEGLSNGIYIFLVRNERNIVSSGKIVVN